MRETEFIIRAALAEETNNGWIWICGPSTKDLAPRTVVKLRRPGRQAQVYTEVRKIDDNFLKRYNDRPRIDIDPTRDTIVMAEWYRKALAISKTTKSDNQIDTVHLIVEQSRLPIWRSLRAACHHPDPVVRLGTRLGMLGAWLGFLGVWLGLLGVWPAPSVALALGFGILVLLGIIGVRAGLGPPRPRLK